MFVKLDSDGHLEYSDWMVLFTRIGFINTTDKVYMMGGRTESHLHLKYVGLMWSLLFLDTYIWVVGTWQDLWLRIDTKIHTCNGRVGQQSRREDFVQNRSRPKCFPSPAGYIMIFFGSPLIYQCKVCCMDIPLKRSTVCVKYWSWIGYFSNSTDPFVTNGPIFPFTELHAQKRSTILSSIANTCVIKSQREGGSSHSPLTTFASSFDFDTWNDNLHETWFHPTVKIVYGIGCAHKHLISESHVGSNLILASQVLNWETYDSLKEVRKNIPSGKSTSPTRAGGRFAKLASWFLRISMTVSGDRAAMQSCWPSRKDTKGPYWWAIFAMSSCICVLNVCMIPRMGNPHGPGGKFDASLKFCVNLVSIMIASNPAAATTPTEKPCKNTSTHHYW